MSDFMLMSRPHHVTDPSAWLRCAIRERIDRGPEGSRIIRGVLIALLTDAAPNECDRCRRHCPGGLHHGAYMVDGAQIRFALCGRCMRHEVVIP